MEENNTVYVKKNGEVTLIYVTPEMLKSMKESCAGVCGRCDNGYASKCLKVADETIRPIEMYDFITDGFQTMDSEGKADEIFIAKCNNYKEDRPRKKATSTEQLQELRRLKESLKIAYFDAMDIDEADQTQFDLRRRSKYRLIMPEELNQVNSENAKGRK